MSFIEKYREIKERGATNWEAAKYNFMFIPGGFIMYLILLLGEATRSEDGFAVRTTEKTVGTMLDIAPPHVWGIIFSLISLSGSIYYFIKWWREDRSAEQER